MPAISPNRPAVTITIDRPRDVRYSWSSICRFEETYGKALPKAFLDDVGPRLLTYVAWAGLLHAEPTLKVIDVEKRIDRYLTNGGNVNDLSLALMKALLESGVLGKVEPKVDEDADPNAAASPEEVQILPAE